MKKYLSLLLTLALIFSLAGPAQAVSAATIKLNKTDLILYVGDSTTLKVSGTSKTIKWSSKNNTVATVSSKGKVSAKNIGKTIIIGKIGSKSYSCKVEVRSNKLTDRLYEIDNFVIGDLWSEGFCNIGWYISSGTNYVGGNLDIDKTLKELKSSMSQLKIYDKYITGLKGSEYESLQAAWADLYKEAQALYKNVLSTPPKAKDSTSTFNPDTFVEYRDKFSSECSYFN
jgi:hypothetical protein